MKTTVKHESDTRVKVTITAGRAELEAAEQVALKRLAKKVKVNEPRAPSPDVRARKFLLLVFIRPPEAARTRRGQLLTTASRAHGDDTSEPHMVLYA